MYVIITHSADSRHKANIMDDDLLNDLDSLGDDDEKGSDNEEISGEANGDDENASKSTASNIMSLIKSSKKDKDSLSSLRRSIQYTSHMKDVHECMESHQDEQADGNLNDADNPEYNLIVSSNKIIQQIDEEMMETVGYIQDLYKHKFPELESLVPNKLDYVKTVHRIGNNNDVNNIRLNDILPKNTIMILSVTTSMTNINNALSAEDLKSLNLACEEALKLQEDKESLMTFLESRMNRLAPNLTALIGSRVASHLIGLAGNLINLSQIPSCNVEILGHERRTLNGMSTLSSTQQFGILMNCDLVQSAPPALWRRAIKVLSGKVTICARVDAYNNNPDCADGVRFFKEIQAKIDKWQEPDKARTKKALPIPDEAPKKKRGGRKFRKLREKYAQTELAALRNKVSFNINDESTAEYGDSAMGLDQGMVGRKDLNRLRSAQAVKKEMHLSKKQKKAMDPNKNANAHRIQDGLSSSLVFTPVQGMELANPNQAKERVAQANASWFNQDTGFLSAVPK